MASELADFVRARTAEDLQRIAAYAGHPAFPGGAAVRRHWRLHAADCEVRLLLAEHAERAGDDQLLRLLALPHAAHPDYRAQWSAGMPDLGAFAAPPLRAVPD